LPIPKHGKALATRPKRWPRFLTTEKEWNHETKITEDPGAVISINLTRLQGWQPQTNGDAVVTLRDGTQLQCSRRRRKALEQSR
jgi:hypothetical protein